MSKISETIMVICVMVGIGALVAQTTVALIALPDTDYKKTAITLAIPIVGAIAVGIALEFFKFIILRRKEEADAKKDAIAKITKLIVSLSMLAHERDGMLYARDMAAFKENIQELLYIASSLGSVESIEGIAPLVEIFDEPEIKLNLETFRESLVSVLVGVRKNLGFPNTEKTTKVVKSLMRVGA